MTRAYTEDPKLFSEKLIKVFTFVMIWGTLVAGILVLFSEYWIPFFLGKSYLNSIDAFNIWHGLELECVLICCYLRSCHLHINKKY